MDSTRLHYFCVVSETGSVRKAAELLRLSPAALSKAVKLLESETGLKLIVPSGRGILITDQGRELAKRGKPVLDSPKQLPTEITAAEDPTMPARIGSFEVFTTYFLAPLLKHSELANANLTLREVIPGELEQALLDREIDFGITYIPIPTADLEHIKITQIEMGIYARRGTFEEVEFSKLPFVVPVHPLTGAPTKVQGLDGWPDNRIHRNIKYRVTLMESALELCRQGLAAAYLPQFVVKLHNTHVIKEAALKKLPSPSGLGSFKQPVYLVKRKADLEGKLTRQLAKAIRIGCSAE